MNAVEEVAALIAVSRRLVVLTGAGISTDSGLHDYRGEEGVWTRRDAGLPPKWGSIAMDEALPNANHRALVALDSLVNISLLIS